MASSRAWKLTVTDMGGSLHVLYVLSQELADAALDEWKETGRELGGMLDLEGVAESPDRTRVRLLMPYVEVRAMTLVEYRTAKDQQQAEKVR